MVFQVNTAKRRGIAKFPSFHPKFWLLRYIDEQNNPLYRVVVLSRNLTFDRSWDITFCMDGKVNGRKTLKTSPVGDFLSYLVGQLPADENAKAKQKKIRAIQRELPFVHFELNSREFDDFEFLPVGVKNSNGGFHSTEDEPFNPLFNDSCHEVLVMSPFLSNSVIREFKEKYFADHPDEVGKVNKDTFWLKRRTLDRYDKVPNNNARLDRVMAHTFKDNAELLLWVPPARPYYQPQGVFKNVSDFSKTLVFSSWEMVPRMIAGLLSYEAERKTVGKLAKANEDKEAHYFYTGEKRYPSARLNFSVSNGTPNAMTLFCLMYPSQFLSRCYDPIDCINRGLTLREIEKEIKGKIADKLVKYETTTSGVQDKRWYYIAPLLLDGAGYVTTWLNSDSELTSYDDEDEKTKRQKGFLTHLQALKELYYETDYGRKCNLGKKPDDLLDVLTDMAIASPAIVINRTYQTYCKKGESFPSFLPSQIAKIFINRMNTAESTATVELACGKKSDDAHWQNLLTYCKQGNLQAMFDEYAHLITNGFDADNNLVGNLHHSIATSMDVRTTIYTVDTFNSFKARANGGKEKATALRSHFAVAFTKGDGKEKDADRKKVIRNAFNSPFRPFVLASTSIGQEGLDFHNYCRRIVHWNLPSNPIDLEQREGRINRFECLAIRQNIAKRYGTVSFKKNIWKEMFDEAAKVENGGEGSDLIPFWGLTEKEDMVRIERIVPMYPFSRDELAYERLIKILSLYRLTLGQARQEELLEYIFKNCDDLDEMKNYFISSALQV